MSLATQKHWDLIGKKIRHGIDLPISALRTHQSCGIGEYLDLLPLIDWCKEIGLEVLQLLPVNDSGSDPSPYNTLSSCALNPLLLSLYALPNLSSDLQKQLSEFSVLNQLSRIDYAGVEKKKFAWLSHYYETAGKALLDTPEYHSFIKEHTWVEPYAAFKDPKRTSFYSLLQYLSVQQLLRVKKYAASKGVLLMGDMPILVSGKSADVKLFPQFFDVNFSAGAAPDVYNPNGQYWGFPLFNWENLKKDNYSWWRERLKTASHFYDIYRIDHIVGFFRIWAIPINHPGKEGRFLPDDPKIWLPQGKEHLEMLIRSSLTLPIGEDLGTVPPEVRTVLAEFGICGTKVMRWERKWREDKSFIPPKDYPLLSLTTVSTHDSPTLEMWWRDLPEEAKVFAAFKKWTYAPDLTQEQRREILRESHHTNSLFHINLLQEYFALFSELVWPNPEDERINVPGKILPTNWTYRFRPSLEEFTRHDKLKAVMKELISK
jgi:4-alpha-glucanotransferase